MKIVTRAEWGFRGWSSAPPSVKLGERRGVALHYNGGTPVTLVGAAVPRSIDASHRARGWYGIGYNYVIDQGGAIFEGRGSTLMGSHAATDTKSWNRSHFGIQIAVGGDQKPTPAAYRSALWLIAYLRGITGWKLPVVGHRDLMATLCPGVHIEQWIRGGLPVPGEEDEMQLSDQITLGASGQRVLGKKTVSVEDALDWTLANVVQQGRNLGALDKKVEGLASKLDEILAAVKDAQQST